MRQILHNRDGSVLPVVLIFSIIAVIVVIAFVSGQYVIARPSLLAPSNYQAFLNARSGVWKGLELLNKPKGKDTLKTINTLASGFGDSIFGKATEAIPVSDTGLAADGEPDTIQPYSSDSFGVCEIALFYRGCYEVLQSKGFFRNCKKAITVTLGGAVPAMSKSDTVLFLENKTILLSPIQGKAHYGPIDTIGNPRNDVLTKFISYFQREITDSIDTMRPAPPLLIQNNADFDSIPATVKGPLFIDGTHFDLTWKSKKRIVVLGDLQITGTVACEGMDFLVAGEIKLFDKARFRDVFLFGAKAVTLRDEAVFSGFVVTQSTILVHDRAVVENRSVILVVRKPSPKGKISVFSATFAGFSKVNATVVALGDSLGIKIDRGAQVMGMLWTKGAICLDGKVIGRIRADKFVDGAKAMAGKSLDPISNIQGAILPFVDDVSRYYFPFFMGTLSIIDRREE